MGNPRLKSLASLKRAIREGRKYASETENLKDPDEVSVPAEKTEQVMDQADYNIPTDGVKNTDNMGEARVLDAVTPLDTTLTSEDSDITAEKKAPVEETEQEVSLEKGASFTNKLQATLNKMKSKKIAKTQNVAADIALTPDILSKVASAMIATEKGQQLALQALEDQKAEAVKIATLNELIQANEEFQAQKSLQTKTASAHESSFADLAAFIGNDPEMIEYAKYAYAAGAQDAAMAAEQGAMPAPEAAAVPAGDPAAEQDEIMQAISALLQSGQIDEAGAQQLAEMAAQAAMADQNPELSDEELMMALEQAVQAGLITPEAIQQIMGGAAAPAAPMGPEAGAAEMPAEAGADAAAVPQEAPADVAKTAAAVIGSTMMLKQAAVEEGIVAEEEADITPEDVAAVLEAAVESGELTPEDAAAVEEEIVAAAIEDAEGSDWGSDGEELSQGLEGISEEELVEALAEEGVTEEELAEAIAEIAEEDAAEAEEEVLGDISEKELVEALAEEGVTEEELAEAIAEIAEEDEAEEGLEEEGLEGISEEELVEALAEEGVTEEELAEAIAEIAEEDEAEELALEGSDGDDIEVYDDEEIKEASIKSLISGAVRSARSAGKAALNKAKDTGKAIAGKARDTGKAIAGKARDTGKAIAGKARAAGKATKDAVQDRYTTSHLKLKKEFPFVGKKRKIDGERILRDLGYGGAIVAGTDAIVD